MPLSALPGPRPSVARRKPSTPITPSSSSPRRPRGPSRETGSGGTAMSGMGELMSEAPAPRAADTDWDEAASVSRGGRAGDTLVVDVEGFEGPLDLLLAMARTQKVDIARISVLALAQQYLEFIAEARRLRIEIAADYLVMA